MIIDAHCHVNYYKDEEIKEIIARCKKNNVIFIDNSTNRDNIDKTIKMAEENPGIVFAALGIYPLEALEMSEKELDDIITKIRKNKDKIVAIGEVGMDFKELKDKERDKQQISNLTKFIRLSIELKKPIIVHSRKAELQCIELLEKEKAKKVIMHCFSGKHSLVKRIIENKWMLTIPTSVVRSEHFQKVIELTPVEQLLCETDSPYLHPNRENNNEPIFVIESYKKIAEIKKLKLDEVEKQLEKNWNNLVK